MLVVGEACSFTRWRNSGFFGCGFQGLNPMHADRTIFRCSYVMMRECASKNFRVTVSGVDVGKLSDGAFLVVASFFGRSGRVGSLNFRLYPIRALPPIFGRLTHCPWHDDFS
jgi:hypothetical protein